MSVVELKYSVNDVVNSSVSFLSPFVRSQECLKSFVSVRTVLSGSCDDKVFSPESAASLKKDVLDNILLNSVWAVSGVRDYKEFADMVGCRWDGLVVVKTRKSGGRFLIEVTDDGCGIKGRDLEKVFCRGFSTRNSEGFGLYSAKRVVEGFGGAISVESVPGRFTKVKVVI